jgi:hypothetical protein
MNEFIVTIDASKVTRYLSEVDQSKVQEFLGLVDRAYQKKPDQKDLSLLRKWIRDYPNLWRVVFDTAQLIEDNLIKNMLQSEASKIALKKNTDDIREGFGYYQSPMMEQMLIDNIIISWLDVQYANYMIAIKAGINESMVILEFWERRLNIAQARYLRACETLAKIRRLSARNPTLQVNIATQSGQQVNVAGDLVKKQ